MSDSAGIPSDARTARLDVRLAVGAVAAWLGAQSGLLLGASHPVATTLGALAGALALGVLLGSRSLSDLGLVLAVAGLAWLVGVGSAALRLVPLAAGPLGSYAAQGAAVRGEVVLTSDPVRKVPKVIGERRGPALVEVGAALLTFTARGADWRLRVPVLVRGGSDLLAYGPGTRLAVAGVLRPPDYRVGIAAIISLRGTARVVKSAAPVWRATTSMRHRLAADCAGLSPDVRGLLPGLAVGDTSAVPPDLLADMKVTGLTHLVAVSGTNTALVLAALLALTTSLRRSARVAVAVIGLAGFVILVRPQPSVSRAAVMGLVAVSALVLGGRRSALPALSGAVLFLVVIDPWLAITYGFSLSVCATAGLVLLAPHVGDWLRGRMPRAPQLLLDAVAVSLAAQVATIPLIVALAGYVSPTSLPANLMAAPAVGAATVLGVLAALAGQWIPPLAGLFVHLAAVPTWWIASVAHWFAGVPTLGLPSGLGGGLLALAGIGAFALLVRLARRRSLLLVGIALLALLVRVGVGRGPTDWPPAGWVFVACDVGQGDALVLADGPGRAIVVDAGPDPRRIDRCLTRLGIKMISLLVITHFHADHVAGLSGVLHRRQLAGAVTSPYRDPPAEAAGALGLIGVAVRSVAIGDRIATDSWDLRVLWPPSPASPGSAAARAGGPNDEGVVVAATLRASGLAILLGADVGPGPQASIESTRTLGVSVVKVPHHGSAYQATGFARWLRAPLAIVSVGVGNPYGHPVAATLERYRAAGATVLRTDESGDIGLVLVAGRLAYRVSR